MQPVDTSSVSSVDSRSGKRPYILTALFLVYALAIWACVSFWGELDRHTLFLTLATAGVSVVFGTFALGLTTFCRQVGCGGMAELVVAMFGRSGVLAACVFFCLMDCDEKMKRSYATRVLIAYFATAPLHVLFTLPGIVDGGADPRQKDEKDGASETN